MKIEEGKRWLDTKIPVMFVPNGTDSNPSRSAAENDIVGQLVVEVSILFGPLVRRAPV